MSYGKFNVTSTGNASVSGSTLTNCVKKEAAETAVTVALNGAAFAGVSFKFVYSPDGTNWYPAASYDNSTQLPIAGSTTISPTDDTETSWTIPNALNMLYVGVNVSAYGSGTATFSNFGGFGNFQPVVIVNSSAGSFTTGTFSSTLSVTGLSTFTGGSIYPDNAAINIGTGDDIVFAWDATRLNVTQATTNSEIRWGVDGAGIDQRWYGDTASAYALWDQSADQLILGGVATISGVRIATGGATAITTTRAVTKADSGGNFTVDQGTAYTITVATPGGAGERYLFQLVGPAAHDVSLVATGCTFEGTIQIDGTGIPATGSTLKFASGAAVLGDTIELVSYSATKFTVRAISSGTGGITVS